MFRGNHPAKMDERGRLKLPTAFRQGIDAQYDNRFFITSTDGHSIQIHPMREWERQEELLSKASSLVRDSAAQRYLILTSYYGEETEMDSQGRLLLPRLLRETAKLGSEVVVIGRQRFLEVADRSDFEQRIGAEHALSDDDRRRLAEILNR